MHQSTPHRSMHNQVITKEETTKSLSGMQQKGPEKANPHVFTNTAPLLKRRSSTSSKSTLSKGLGFPDRRAVMKDSKASLKPNNAYFPASFSVPPSRSASAISLNLAHRRSASETDVHLFPGTGRSRSQRNLSLANYQRKATCMMAQRSNAQGVKQLVSKLKQKCDIVTASQTEDLTQRDDNSPDTSPFPECAMLSQVSKDAYYRVVIGSVDGIAALIEAMKTFASHANLQEACCTALGNLCERNGSNQLAIQKNEGIQQIVAAMRLHSTSIAVQSAACDALRNMSVILLTPSESSQAELLSDVTEVLTNAIAMYITLKSKERAHQLLIALQIQDAAANLIAVDIAR